MIYYIQSEKGWKRLNNVLTLEASKYAIKIDDFEGPLDLLCYLIDKNKMEISKVKIADITDQYLEYIKINEGLNLELTSEFLIMASNLILIKSKKLLPKEVEDEAELTEEELLNKIIEYKKYKEVSQILKDDYIDNKNRFFKKPDNIELKKQKIEDTYSKQILNEIYENLIIRSKERINQNAQNIEKIAVAETISVASKVKQIFRELVRNSRFIFSKLFSIGTCSKMEVITAFSGLLELNRRNKVSVNQEELFGDIIVEKSKKD